MKKKLIIGGIVGLLSFLLGLGGFYMMMPKVDPKLVENTKVDLDSLGLIHYSAADSIRAVRDSIAASGDTLDHVPIAAFVEESAHAEDGAAIIDSLRAVVDRMRTVESEKARLLTEIESLTRRIQAMDARRVEAENLSTTLAKLEDRQLGAILSTLDEGVLQMLYVKASPRNQGRLLQAMPPERAASFIRSLVNGSPPAPAAPTATPPTSTPAKHEAAPATPAKHEGARGH